MKFYVTISGVIIGLMVTGPVEALSNSVQESTHPRWVTEHDTRLAKFKQEQKRIVPDKRKRSILFKINQKNEDKKKRDHYKRDLKRVLDKRIPASSNTHDDPRFPRRGLSEEQIKHYMERYRARKRLREKYDGMSRGADAQ